jgi:hypothetical protein
MGCSAMFVATTGHNYAFLLSLMHLDSGLSDRYGWFFT